ncbi:MAG: hypothetical protein EA422_09005, partial [Gemmatimonadales bacterium]
MDPTGTREGESERFGEGLGASLRSVGAFGRSVGAFGRSVGAFVRSVGAPSRLVGAPSHLFGAQSRSVLGQRGSFMRPSRLIVAHRLSMVERSRHAVRYSPSMVEHSRSVVAHRLEGQFPLLPIGPRQVHATPGCGEGADQGEDLMVGKGLHGVGSDGSGVGLDSVSPRELSGVPNLGAGALDRKAGKMVCQTRRPNRQDPNLDPKA